MVEFAIRAFIGPNRDVSIHRVIVFKFGQGVDGSDSALVTDLAGLRALVNDYLGHGAVHGPTSISKSINRPKRRR